MNEQLMWIWYWNEGGFNWCRASSREEALEAAKKMASSTVLTVDESSLHRGTSEELNKLYALTS